MIKEVIVVEGRNDISAVKKAVNAEVIATGGFGIKHEVFERIKKAAKTRGIIILTDPDYAGKKIRQIISQEIKNCKHAFISQKEATKDGDIGIENCNPKQIIKALENARAEKTKERLEFSQLDMLHHNLIGNENASFKRDKMGKLLGLGHCSAKQFLKRLNNYDITRKEFDKAIEKVSNHE